MKEVTRAKTTNPQFHTQIIPIEDPYRCLCWTPFQNLQYEQKLAVSVGVGPTYKVLHAKTSSI